jgi:hypothetical protein
MTNDIITIIANVALTLTFIVGVVFGIAQVRAATRDRRERLTLEALRNFQTAEFAELMLNITSREMPSNRKEMLALPLNEQVKLLQFSQQMESLGMLVADKYIDIDLVDKTLGSFVTVAWEKYKPMFIQIREEDPFLGEYFQWLAEQVKERMRNHPRKPFYKTNAHKHNGHSAAIKEQLHVKSESEVKKEANKDVTGTSGKQRSV